MVTLLHTPNHSADTSRLLPSGLDVFAADFAGVEVPEKPIVVIYEAIEFPIPLFGQALVQLFHEGEKRPLGRESLFVSVYGNVGFPAETFSVARKTEAVEKVLPAHQRNVPEAWNAAGIFFDGNLGLQLFQEFASTQIVGEMSS